MATEYRRKDGEQHRVQANSYQAQPTEEDQSAYFKEFGTRWFEFARLPYFDAPTMTIIDPMHNILLGTLLNLISFHCFYLLTVARRCQTTMVRYLDPRRYPACTDCN